MLGHLTARVSYDYVVQPWSYLYWGLKIGFAAGAIVGACQVVWRGRPSASAALTTWALALALTVTSVGLVAGALATFGAYHLGWIDTSDWRLPNPSRHAMLLGVESSLHPCAAVGIVCAAAWVSYRRWTCASR